jgi:hypothetical protein
MSKPRLRHSKVGRKARAAAKTTVTELTLLDVYTRVAKTARAVELSRGDVEGWYLGIKDQLNQLSARQNEIASSVAVIEGDIAQIQKYVGALASASGYRGYIPTPPTPAKFNQDGSPANMRGGTGVYPGEAGYVPPWHEVPPR